MFRYMKSFIALLITFLVPALTFAQQFDLLPSDEKLAGTEKTFATLVYGAGGFFQSILVTIIAASFLFFIWGLARNLLRVGTEEGRKASKNIMVWGVIGLFVSMTVFGILTIVLATVGL